MWGVLKRDPLPQGRQVLAVPSESHRPLAGSAHAKTKRTLCADPLLAGIDELNTVSLTFKAVRVLRYQTVYIDQLSILE